MNSGKFEAILNVIMMLKNLLILIVGLTVHNGLSQVLYSETFTNYTVGNIGTDLSGATSGQGGWLTYGSSDTSSNSDFTITTNGNPGKGIRILGIDNNVFGGYKMLWKSGFPALWNSRTMGNNIIEVESDYYSPAWTMCFDDINLMILDASLTKVLAGFSIDERGPIGAKLYTNSANGYGNWTYVLGEDSSFLVLPPEVWVKLILRFNKTTGEATFIIKNADGTVFRQASFMGATAGLDPAQIQYAIYGMPNFSYTAATATFDNFKITALNSNLAVDEVSIGNELSIFPNPATDEITVLNPNQIGISSIVLRDINGRIVKQITFDNLPDVQINIAELSSGLYLMKITSAEGISTKKIIKN